MSHLCPACGHPCTECRATTDAELATLRREREDFANLVRDMLWASGANAVQAIESYREQARVLLAQRPGEPEMRR